MDNKERLARLAALLDGDENAALEFIKECKAVRNRSFVTFIDRYIESRGLQRNFIIREANLNPQYGYKLLNGTKHTNNRNIILRICLATRMSVEDTQEALRCYNMRLLDIEVFRDEIIMAGIEKHKSLYDVDIWLRKAGQVSLYDDCT